MPLNLKHILTVLAILVTSVSLRSEVKGSHFYGISLSYECINNCTTRVHQRVFVGCAGSYYISNQIGITPDSSNCPMPDTLTGWSTQLVTEITPVCPTVSTDCSTPASSIPGIQEFYVHRDYGFCSVPPNCNYEISWTSCCRNPAITSVASAGSQTGGVFDQLSLSQGCNTSPIYTTSPFLYLCAGMTTSVSMGGTDPDGDEVVYVLDTCRGVSSSTAMPYQTGFSPTQPLGTTWNVSLDSLSGLLTITPTPGNIAVGIFCITAYEYRNGVLIASNTRDLQVSIINCPGNNEPQITPVTNLSAGATLTGPQAITACQGIPLCFHVGAFDPDSSQGQSVTIHWDASISGATYTDSSNPNQTDTLTGNSPDGVFCWANPSPGIYPVAFAIQDDNCPIISKNDHVITITVLPPNVTGTVTLSNGTTPLANAPVYLVTHDSTFNALTAIDTVTTDANGYYEFCGVIADTFYLKAAPQLPAYPNHLPTYSDTAVYFNNAAFYTAASTPLTIDWSVRQGGNPGGPGFIGGLISQGANKREGPGDPMPDVQVFLYSTTLGQFIETTSTDSSGYFSFSSIPLGDYKISVDEAGVDNVNVPAVSISSQVTSLDSMDLRLHSTYLELHIPTDLAQGQAQENRVDIFPNPSDRDQRVRVTLTESAPVEIEVYDIKGNMARILAFQELEPGDHLYRLSDLSTGTYFLKVQIGDQIIIKKITRW